MPRNVRPADITEALVDAAEQLASAARAVDLVLYLQLKANNYPIPIDLAARVLNRTNKERVA